MKWKPIETYKIGPNDGDQGEEVLVYSWGSRKQFVARGKRMMGMICFTDEGYGDPRVAHWMQLPADPEN